MICGLCTGSASATYLDLSLFLAFATLYPNLQFLLFFIIPVKAKWLAWLDAALLAFNFISYLAQGAWLLCHADRGQHSELSDLLLGRSHVLCPPPEAQHQPGSHELQAGRRGQKAADRLSPQVRRLRPH